MLSAHPFVAVLPPLPDDARARIARTHFEGWPGATHVAQSLEPAQPRFSQRALSATRARLKRMTPYATGVTPRGGRGRLPAMNKLDIALASTWEAQMRAHCPEYACVDSAVASVEAMLRARHDGICLSRWLHLLVTYAGSDAQAVHADYAQCDGVYVTVVFNLTDHAREGRTSFMTQPRREGVARFLTEDTDGKHRAASYGDAVVAFDGTVLHRGEPNCSACTRLSLAVVLSTESSDANDGE